VELVSIPRSGGERRGLVLRGMCVCVCVFFVRLCVCGYVCVCLHLYVCVCATPSVCVWGGGCGAPTSLTTHIDTKHTKTTMCTHIYIHAHTQTLCTRRGYGLPQLPAGIPMIGLFWQCIRSILTHAPQVCQISRLFGFLIDTHPYTHTHCTHM
jgi:hypothetical protein